MPTSRKKAPSAKKMRARVTVPGRLLVVAEKEARQTTDPVMASFLVFLAKDISHAPRGVGPLNAMLGKRVDELTNGVAISFDVNLGDGVSI